MGRKCSDSYPSCSATEVSLQSHIHSAARQWPQTCVKMNYFRDKKDKESCNRWCGPLGALISTSLSQSGITRRDRRHRSSLKIQNWGTFSRILAANFQLSTVKKKKKNFAQLHPEVGEFTLHQYWFFFSPFAAFCIKLLDQCGSSWHYFWKHPHPTFSTSNPSHSLCMHCTMYWHNGCGAISFKIQRKVFFSNSPINVSLF